MSEDGKALYVSSMESVYRYSYNPDTATVADKTTLVTGMSHPDGGGHVTRTLLLSKKQPDLLLVSRGSASNIDPTAAQQSSGVSQIRAFNISSPTTPYDYTTDGLLVGWGLRNSVGVAEHPSTGTIWSVENSADNLAINNIDIHEDNPGEELNSHGTLPHPAGSNHGYPTCYTLWNTTLPSALTPLFPNPTIGMQFPLSATTATSITATCGSGNYTPARLTFQAHTAPLDIKFLPSANNTNTEQALITFHGSCPLNPSPFCPLSAVSGALESKVAPELLPSSPNRKLLADIVGQGTATTRQATSSRPSPSRRAQASRWRRRGAGTPRRMCSARRTSGRVRRWGRGVCGRLGLRCRVGREGGCL